ncbi:natural resistance-associated macrophage 2-like [Brachionus plicatilis]|uniref:Natural resistance-associated macrophage 2-like n=1 Tax=Brachionus plicatilis TaxID=10195 RepID=A0A3M7Q106_BRAPC|nr:natural resistance-associated macrophage 2-like [Brachionus plicatilis]
MEEEEIYTEESPLLMTGNKNSINHDSVFVSDLNTNSTSALFSRNVTISTNSDRSDQSFLLIIKKLWKYTGPGLLISVAFLDPGNLDTDLQSGAIAGYKLLWVLMYSTLAGYLLQLLSVRLGTVTELHLAEICAREYGILTRYFLWIMIEISIIASDIQQVIGSALALNILSNQKIDFWIAVLITGADVFVFLLLESKGIRVLEAIFAILISIMGFSFFYMFIRANPDKVEIIKGIAYPWCENCSGLELKQLVGIIGSIVMPHNLFFHSALVLSRNFERTSEPAVKEANKYFAIESAMALFVSFVLNLFITSVSAKSFYKTESDNITLFNSDKFIYQEYGIAMKIIWAIGLLSAGQCSTITGTYAGQFIMEGLTKINLSKWKRIIVTRLISILPCIVICFFTIDSIVYLNFWCNIIKAIQIPFALLPILHFTSSRRIMGAFRNNFFLKLVCYLITFGVLFVNVYFITDMIMIKNNKIWSYVLGTSLVIYIFFVIFFFLGVNNIYRIKLFFRRIFCQHNAYEIDELLHRNPIYRRPERRRQISNRDEYIISHSVPVSANLLHPSSVLSQSSTSHSPRHLSSNQILKKFSSSSDNVPPFV